MKGFIKYSRLLPWVLVAAGAWTVGFFYNVYLGGYPSWLRSTYELKVALAKKINQPKIIVAGGSGVQGASRGTLAFLYCPSAHSYE